MKCSWIYNKPLKQYSPFLHLTQPQSSTLLKDGTQWNLTKWTVLCYMWAYVWMDFSSPLGVVVGNKSYFVTTP